MNTNHEIKKSSAFNDPGLDGNVVESGTYKVENKQLVVTTEQGMNMNADISSDSGKLISHRIIKIIYSYK